MGAWHTLYTPCGAVQAWRADPAGTPRGAVVVAHEIFGLLPHYQRLCERLADAGFIALAPAYFDLIEPGLVLPTDQAGTDRGRIVVNRLGLDCGVDATETAVQLLQAEGHEAGVLGFSWGGTVALLANTRAGAAGGQLLRHPQSALSGRTRAGAIDIPLRLAGRGHPAGHHRPAPAEAAAVTGLRVRRRRPRLQPRLEPGLSPAGRRAGVGADAGVLGRAFAISEKIAGSSA